MKLGLIIILYLLSTAAFAVEVRGRVDFQGYNGTFPMNRAVVEFCYIKNRNGCTGYNTGYDGMYYLHISHGNHEIFVNRRFRGRIFIPPVSRFDVQVFIGN
jgi:hypothetical protein